MGHSRSTTAGNSLSGHAPGALPLATKFAFLAFAFAFSASSAHADPASKVYLPQVVYGEWELELRGGFENWNHSDGDNAQQYVFDIGRGVTSWWFSELALFYSNAPGAGGAQWEEFKTENIFQLTQPGQYWLDLGLIAELVRNRAEGVNEIEIGPLFQKEVGNEQFNVDFEFERQLTRGAKTELTYAWQWKHRGNPRAELGLQGFGELGEVGDLGQEHVHKIGPALFGQARLAGNDKLKYDAAVLFGMTRSTPDVTLRLQLEYEMYGH